MHGAKISAAVIWRWIPGVSSGAEGAGGRVRPRPQSEWRTKRGGRDSQDRDRPRLGNSSGVRARRH